ncbi:hypothetical protein B0E46_11570 [Rhodanobacter sp. B04]|uniref:M56 family metallopeptidase n=1 Tax=Rhodanobacter sp. B04 TaxID=1945860 RepID=UPI0009844866|nr:M56 family metallopeptidase [Rhodanobacter sp. B04]OOG62859.1 hypothetical protein B0E46_11570 [Rhodanobacter sp. B04]
MDAIHILADTLLVRLAWTSAQATLLISALWLLGRCMPRLSPAIRCLLWWVISLQLIIGLAASTPVKLPLLSPAAQADPIAATLSPQVVSTTPSDEAATPLEIIAPSPPAASAMTMAQTPVHASMPAHPFPWRSLVVTLWLAGLLAQLLLVARQWRKTRQVLRESTTLRDATLQAACSQQARMLGLRRCPQLRVSHAITSPQVTGLWRATVLLPASQVLTAEESSLALAHELAHLRRGDLWLGWAPAIAQRLFFFHPLVAWAMREYALHREAACDAQVLLQHRAAPQDYGRLLLRLGVAQPMHSGLAGASPTFQNLKRRLTMLQQGTNHSQWRTRGWWLVVPIALVGVLPYRVTATNATSMAAAQTGTQTGDSPAAPPPPPPAPPAPPAMPPPAPPPPRFASDFSAHHVDITTHSDARDGFALFDGDSVTINGTDNDLAIAKQLHRGSEPMLWFRRGDQAYVIREAGYIQRARAAYAPVAALARQQSQLGAQQGQLGGKQGALGARQGALGSRQGQLASQEAALAARSAQNQPSAALEAQRARLEASQGELGRQQDELSRQQQALGKQQEALGAQQEALGKRQQQATEQANQQIRKLLEEAIEHGAAQKLGMNPLSPLGSTQARQLRGLPPTPPMSLMPPMAKMPAPPPAPPAPPLPIAPPPPPPATTTTSTDQTRRRDSDITTVEPGSKYAYALYDNNARGETVLINGDHTDVATAKRLHATDTAPMFWFRRGDQAYLVRDPAYVDRASAAYAPVSAYWRDAGKFEGETWKLKGPLEGLHSQQRSVEEQRRDLLADPQAPAAAQRLASLDAQQREITAQMADLNRQLAALKPQRDAMAQREQQIVAQANQQASQLIDEALRKGVAQEVSRR